MRVIAGQFRSRPLQAPSGLDVRPTSGRLRETLFNVLAPRIPGAVFLDLCAGSGAVGIEALSRGVRQAIFVEQAPPSLRAIRSNLDALGIRGGYSIEPRSVASALRRLLDSRTPGRAIDIVFLDPPWADEDQYALALNLLGGECRPLLAPHAIVVAEHRRRRTLDEHYASLARYRTLAQGDAALTFYARQSALAR